MAHTGAMGGGVVCGTHGVLHPRVGREDEHRGNHGAKGGQVDAGQVDSLGELVPPEDPQADEGRLHEEGEEGLEGQRGAEDVADESRVLRPVHTELELLHDSGDDAEGEVDEEELAVELGQAKITVVTGLEPHRLHHCHEHRQRDRDRDEEEVVDRRDPELPSGDQLGIHGAHPTIRRPRFWRSGSRCAKTDENPVPTSVVTAVLVDDLPDG